MGWTDIIKPLSTVLSSVVNKSQQHKDKNSEECLELNLGLLGEKQVCYQRAIQPPKSPILLCNEVRLQKGQ